MGRGSGATVVVGGGGGAGEGMLPNFGSKGFR